MKRSNPAQRTGNSAFFEPKKQKLDHGAAPQRVDCPNCGTQVVLEFVNTHLDDCVGTKRLSADKPSVQKSLNSFLNLPDYSLPNYFYLEKTSSGRFVAYFLRDRPQDVQFTWRCEVGWAGTKLIVCSNVKGGVVPKTSRPDANEIPFCQRNLPPETRYRNLPFIKSHLQKCIRRGKADLAVKTAVHFIRMDLTAFLRRLSIIAIEDVCMNDAYLVLVWILSACSKGFLLSGELLAFLLGYTSAISCFNFKDASISFADPSEHPQLPSFTAASQEVWQLPSERRDWIFALQLRKSFGGMKGDQNLLENASRTWMHRFTNAVSDAQGSFKVLAPFNVSPLRPETVQPLHIEEWDLAALDFHVCDVAKRVELLYEHEATQTQPRLAPISESIVKAAIWNCSSGLNQRQIVDLLVTKQSTTELFYDSSAPPIKALECTEAEKLDPIWKIIKPLFLASAKQILKTKA